MSPGYVPPSHADARGIAGALPNGMALPGTGLMKWVVRTRSTVIGRNMNRRHVIRRPGQ